MTWQRQILRVNLSKGSCEIEPLNMAWADAYLGCRGLGTKYLYEEIDADCEALGPENKLIMATGPLTGTLNDPARMRYWPGATRTASSAATRSIRPR